MVDVKHGTLHLEVVFFHPLRNFFIDLTDLLVASIEDGGSGSYRRNGDKANLFDLVTVWMEIFWKLDTDFDINILFAKAFIEKYCHGKSFAE